MSGRNGTLIDRLRENFLYLLGEEVCRHMAVEDTTDLICNPPLPGEDFCRLWLARLGHDRECVGKMDPSKAIMLIGAVANSMGKVATENTPSVEGVLITDGSRFMGCIRPITDGPFFALRRHSSKVIPFAQYVAEGKMTAEQKAAIEDAVLNRLNILIAGGTGSGKTTLLNGLVLLMAELTPHHRYFFIEDAPELKCSAPDRTMTQTCPTMDHRALVRVALRSFVDRLIIGEARGPEMLDILMAWNTGHDGGATTIHSNIDSPTKALERVEDMVLQASANPLQRMIGNAVNMVVCMHNDRGHRRVTRVVKIKGWDGQNYQTEDVA